MIHVKQFFWPTMSDEIYYLYHIRDRESSVGFGHDGYIGITIDLARREKEHFRNLAKGRHASRLMQDAYNKNGKNFEFYVIASGSRTDMEARERVLVHQSGHHWNSQVGGGPRRGLSQLEAAKLSGREQLKAAATLGAGGRTQQPKNESDKKSASQKFKRGPADNASESTSAGSAPGAVAGVSLRQAVAGAAVVGAAFASGLGTAHVIGKTVLKDDEKLDMAERELRKVGRVAGYAGGGSGAVGMVAAVCFAGEVGITGSALGAGLTAVGISVGGGVAAVIIVPALAAMACAACGYFGYKQIQGWRNRKRVD
jgi:hypothetical protein